MVRKRLLLCTIIDENDFIEAYYGFGMLAKVFNALPLSTVIDACSPSIYRQRAIFIPVSHFILTFKALVIRKFKRLFGNASIFHESHM